MAIDPRCPEHALSAVLAHPTAKRLAYLANLTESDLATDLSSLIVLALEVDAAANGRPRVTPRSSSTPSR